MTSTPWGYACLAIFVGGNVLILLEERLHLRKPIPAMVACITPPAQDRHPVC